MEKKKMHMENLKKLLEKKLTENGLTKEDLTDEELCLLKEEVREEMEGLIVLDGVLSDPKFILKRIQREKK